MCKIKLLSSSITSVQKNNFLHRNSLCVVKCSCPTLSSDLVLYTMLHICVCVCAHSLSAYLTIPPFTPPRFCPSLASEVSSSSVIPLDNKAWNGGIIKQHSGGSFWNITVDCSLTDWKGRVSEWRTASCYCWNRSLTSLMKGMYSSSVA